MKTTEITIKTLLDKRRSFVTDLRTWKEAMGHELDCRIAENGSGVEYATTRNNVERWWMDMTLDYDCSPDFLYDLGKALEDFSEHMFLRRIPFTQTAVCDRDRVFEMADCRFEFIDENHLRWLLHDMQESLQSLQLMYRRKELPGSLVRSWWSVRLSRPLFDKNPPGRKDGWIVLDDEWFKWYAKWQHNKYGKAANEILKEEK